MLVGEVIGRLWNDRQIADLEGRRLVVVRDLASSATIVAVDLIDVAAGNTVLVVTEEGAQSAVGAGGVDAAVIALVGGADELPGAPAQAAGAHP